MKKWEGFLVVGIAEFLLVFTLFLWGLFNRNPDLDVKLLSMLFLFLGAGFTSLFAVYEFHKIEKGKGV